MTSLLYIKCTLYIKCILYIKYILLCIKWASLIAQIMKNHLQCGRPGRGNYESLLYSIRKNKFIEKEIRFVATGGREWGRGGGIDRQKLQTSSYKINKYSGCSVQYDKGN